MPFVSRAGEKLQTALTAFQVHPQDFTCADFGSSTGGFVDCLLQHGAKKVYAVETGYGTLDWKLRQDPRVVVLERTNAMHITLPEPVDLLTIDTSWTKLEKILPNVLKNLQPNGEILALVKPHYEADQKLIRKGALPREHLPAVLEQVRTKIMALGVRVLGEVDSPILGAKGGNKEFLFHLKRK